MIKRPKDEWGVIINTQAEINRQREEAERIRAQQEKMRYLGDLRKLEELNTEKRVEEQRIREIEAFSIRKQAKVYQSEDQQRKLEAAVVNKNLAGELASHSEYVKSRKVLEHQNKLREEQELLNYNQRLLEQERQRKQQIKQEMHLNDLRMLENQASKSKEQLFHAQSERKVDLDLMRLKKEAEEQKERNYKLYFENVQQKQAAKQDMFKKVLATNAEKEFLLHSWVDKSVKIYNQTTEEKAQMEALQKKRAIDNVNSTLKQQLAEKQRVQQEQLELKRKQAEEVQLKIQAARKLEQEQLKNRRQQQNEYLSYLSSQANEHSKMRSSSYMMTETEKKLNSNYVQDTNYMKNKLTLGAQEILKKHQKSASALAPFSALDKSSKPFAGIY